MRKDIDKFSPETRSIIRAQVTRRSLLVGAGAIAGASTLAACGTGSTESGADGIVD
ncbi:MAG: spermidine/putrescine ABC transporter substrate-binding protein, partial [Actinobacteria bacterium]|nr:spermidine/putrescine ABC transporter substrate-binding protein [Actinomycetota bacterium]